MHLLHIQPTPEGYLVLQAVEACVASGAFKAGASAADDSPTRTPPGAAQQVCFAASSAWLQGSETL